MRIVLTLFLGIVLFCARLSAQDFTINDVIVSDFYSEINDTEFDPFQPRLCWQSPYDNTLWVCKLDTITWALAVPDGRQTLVDSCVTPIDQTSNSGEWGFDQNGTFMVYNKYVNHVSYVAIAVEVGSGWMHNVLLDAPHRMNPHATQNPNDPYAAIHYTRFGFSLNTKYKFFDNLGAEQNINCFKDAHWVQGEQLLTGILANQEVGLFDPVNPGPPVQLTFDSKICYTKPFMWHAPEHDNQRMFFTVAEGTEIRVFRELVPGSNNFSIYMAFQSPSMNPNYNKFASPEPYVFEGQSYITFMTSSSECENACAPSEIWIARLDSLAPLFRMISDTNVSIRTDPEPYVAGDSLVTYYTEVDNSILSHPFYRVRKCRTGFGKESPITSSGDIATNGGLPVKVCPNPFTDRITLCQATGKEWYELTGIAGNILWRGPHIEQQDFQYLATGLYFLRVRFGDQEKTLQVVKN